MLYGTTRSDAVPPSQSGTKRSLRAVLSRVSPLLTYFHRFLELSDHLQYEWSLINTHDTLTDWYKYPRSMGQIKRIFSNFGTAEI